MSNNLSSNLKKIRKENNLSQEDLADILGVSRQAISKWESNSAYPEMDKILQICKRFDVNINDLLNNDIVEAKKEEESKNSINKYIDSFLNFLTKTINMFFSFNLKNKIKCLFEQFVIISILISIFCIIGLICSSIFSNLIRILPLGVYDAILGLCETIYYVLAIIFGTIIFLHIFKVRYLDYYEVVKETKTIDNKVDLKQINDNENKTKIIIRDPKHSEYRFIKGLLKLIIGCIKIFSLMMSTFFGFTLVCSIIALVSSFIIVKTGLLFVGILVSLVGIIIINIVVLLTLINFTFNRKSDKKKFIYAFIGSLISIGIGVGLIITSSLSFNVLEDKDILKTNTIEIDMKDNLIIGDYYQNYEFKEADIDNIKIEYQINKYCDIKQHSNNGEYNMFYIHSYCSNPLKLVREFINNINNKKVIDINNEILSFTVYASKENIDKLKNNINKYYENKETINDYKNRIYELEDQVNELKSLNEELEHTNDYYEEKIKNYENDNE